MVSLDGWCWCRASVSPAAAAIALLLLLPLTSTASLGCTQPLLTLATSSLSVSTSTVRRISYRCPQLVLAIISVILSKPGGMSWLVERGVLAVVPFWAAGSAAAAVGGCCI